MTDTEAKLARSKIDVEMQRSRVEGARVALREGKLKALAEFNAKVDELQKSLEREEIQLKREETFVAEWQWALDHPFAKRDEE